MHASMMENLSKIYDWNRHFEIGRKKEANFRGTSFLVFSSDDGTLPFNVVSLHYNQLGLFLDERIIYDVLLYPCVFYDFTLPLKQVVRRKIVPSIFHIIS